MSSGKLITEIYALIYPESETSEGICAVTLPDPRLPWMSTTLPTIGGDMERIRAMWPLVKQGMPASMVAKIKLVKFTNRVDISEALR